MFSNNFDEDAIAAMTDMYFIKASSLHTILWQQWLRWCRYKDEWDSLCFENNLFSTEQGHPCEGGSSYGPSPLLHIALNSPYPISKIENNRKKHSKIIKLFKENNSYKLKYIVMYLIQLNICIILLLYLLFHLAQHLYHHHVNKQCWKDGRYHHIHQCHFQAYLHWYHHQ